MKASVKKHFKDNYLMYLIFIAIFLIVLVAMQNYSIRNDGLSRRERDQVKQLIKNADLPKNNRNILFWLAVFIILFMIFLYNFVMKKDMEIHRNIKQTVKKIIQQGNSTRKTKYSVQQGKQKYSVKQGQQTKK